MTEADAEFADAELAFAPEAEHAANDKDVIESIAAMIAAVYFLFMIGTSIIFISYAVPERVTAYYLYCLSVSLRVIHIV